MTASGPQSTTDEDVYDWWSRHPHMLSAFYEFVSLGRHEDFRQRYFDVLDASPGENVLEVGCGNGNGLRPVRTGIGSTGELVAIDRSDGMIQSAQNTVEEHDWENVHIVQCDVLRSPLCEESFDVAYASMSISAISDPVAAIRSVESALRPGGRFVILDAQPFQTWPYRLLNPIIIPLAKRSTDWSPSVDLFGALQETFETIEFKTFNAGSMFIVRSWKSDED